MKRSAIITALLAIIALASTNCSDESPSSPEVQKPPLYAIGKVGVDGGLLVADIEVYEVRGFSGRVDSAYVDGEDRFLCIQDIPHAVANDGRQIISHTGSEWCPSDNPPAFSPGDTTEFSMYCRGSAHRASLHLLDAVEARPRNAGVRVDGRVDSTTVSWTEVADAEWYAVKVRFRSTLGESVWYHWCGDSLTTGFQNPYPWAQLYWVTVYIASATGPMPSAERRPGNITGEHIRGSLYSVSNDAILSMHINSGVLVEGPPPDESFDAPDIIDLIRREELKENLEPRR